MHLDQSTLHRRLSIPSDENTLQLTLEHQILHWVLLFSGCATLLRIGTNLLLALPLGHWLWFGAIGQLLLYGLVRSRRLTTEQAKWAPFAAYLVLSSEAWFSHAGLEGSTTFFVICPIITAMILLHGWSRLATMALLLGHLATLVLCERLYPTLVLPYPNPAVKQLDFLFSLGAVAFYCIGTVAIVTYQLEQRRHQADKLLRNMLPLTVAETLKHQESKIPAIANHFDRVSIMFIDVVDFTTLAADLPPSTVVTMLGEIFSTFDRLAETYGVEKIKTIGDCYMVVAGAPYPRPDHAQALVRMALAVQEYAKHQSFGLHPLHFRIGINSGPVVAGIIGQKKFIYDVWGDTVNIASRMESHGQAGTIQISRATYELIANDFLCEERGAIPIKGKGLMEIWHVTGKQPARPVVAPVNRLLPNKQAVRRLRQSELYGYGEPI